MEKSSRFTLLHNSLYRPRDIARFLISVQDQYPNDTSFVLQGLEAIRKNYSSASWVELTEELKTRYKPSEIDGIKYILFGYKPISSLAEINARADLVAIDHKQTADLLSRTSVKEFMKDLYRIRVIGNFDNRAARMRFSFGGDDEILFDQDIFVHSALRAHLSMIVPTR